MTSSSKGANEIARHKSGSGDDEAVDHRIGIAWEELVGEQRDEFAAILSVSPASLDPKKPPFRAETLAGGITGAEVAIVFLGGAVVELAKEAGAAVAKTTISKARVLWDRYMDTRVRDPKNPTLGERIDDESDDVN